MKVGDWIEMYDSPGTRGIVVEGGIGDDLRVLVSGDEEPRTVWSEDLRQWWDVLAPSDDTVPSWVKVGALFVPREIGLPNHAVVYALWGGWVAYHDSTLAPKVPVFMLTRWLTFHQHWAPLEPPTAWSRLIEDDDA
jgi:hypothetical protein